MNFTIMIPVEVTIEHPSQIAQVWRWLRDQGGGSIVSSAGYSAEIRGDKVLLRDAKTAYRDALQTNPQQGEKP